MIESWCSMFPCMISLPESDDWFDLGTLIAQCKTGVQTHPGPPNPHTLQTQREHLIRGQNCSLKVWPKVVLDQRQLSRLEEASLVNKNRQIVIFSNARNKIKPRLPSSIVHRQKRDWRGKVRFCFSKAFARPFFIENQPNRKN